MKHEEIAAELSYLTSSIKTLASTAEWVGDNASGRQPMRRLTVPLAIEGVIKSGLVLKALEPRAVPLGRPFYDLTARLEAVVDHRLWHLGRIDFDPGGNPPHHRNKLNAMRFAPAEVTGTHYHPFAENLQIGLECLEPASNLPVALPEVQECYRYDDVLGVVSRRFLIEGFWTEDPEGLLLLA